MPPEGRGLPAGLHRHQLLWLGDAGWSRLLAAPHAGRGPGPGGDDGPAPASGLGLVGHGDELGRLGAGVGAGVDADADADAGPAACLAHWAAHRLPLVVGCQGPASGGGLSGPPSDPSPGGLLALGLAAPRRFGRRRLALRVPRADICGHGEFPRAERITELLPEAARPSWRRCCGQLQDAGRVARVYGSFGWQALSGLQHVREGSDLDLWIAVDDARQADDAAAALGRFRHPALRLDGELVFGGGRAVAWREWQAWREGRSAAMLVKHLGGAALAQGLDHAGAPVFALQEARA